MGLYLSKNRGVFTELLAKILLLEGSCYTACWLEDRTRASGWTEFDMLSECWRREHFSTAQLAIYLITGYAISRPVLKNVLPPPALRQHIKLCPADWLLFGLPAIRQCSNFLPTEVSLRIIMNIFIFS